MAIVIDELIALLGYDLKGEENLRQYNKSLDAVEKKAAAVGAVIGKTIAVAGIAAAGAFAFLGKSVLDTAAKFETYQATLETIEGSTEKATKALDWIKNFAQTTPYEVDELTAAFVKLRSYGLDPMDGTMTVLGDTAAGMGKRIDQVVEALADASTFQFERLRELGIVASQAGDKVTFAWTENGKAMSKTVKKTSEEVTKFLNETWGKKFGGAMIKQSKTWTGMMSNLGDSWTAFQLKIANAGFFDTVKNRLGDLMNRIAELDANGTLDRWAQNLSTAFTTTADVVSHVVGRIIQVMEALGNVLGGGAGTGILVTLGLITAAMWPWFAVALLVAAVVDDIMTHLEGGDSIIGKIIAKFEALAATIRELLGLASNTPVLPAEPSTVQGSADLLRDPTFDPYANNGRFFQDEAKRKAEAARINGQPVGMTSDAEDWKWALQNAEGNAAKVTGGAAATIQDNKQDHHDQSVNVTAPVTIQVQQATQAPAAAGEGIAGAINNAVQPSRMQGGSMME